MGATKELAILVEDMQAWSATELLDAWMNAPDKVESQAAHAVLVNRVEMCRRAHAVVELMEHEESTGGPL